MLFCLFFYFHRSVLFFALFCSALYVHWSSLPLQFPFSFFFSCSSFRLFSLPVSFAVVLEIRLSFGSFYFCAVLLSFLYSNLFFFFLAVPFPPCTNDCFAKQLTEVCYILHMYTRVTVIAHATPPNIYKVYIKKEKNLNVYVAERFFFC